MKFSHLNAVYEVVLPSGVKLTAEDGGELDRLMISDRVTVYHPCQVQIRVSFDSSKPLR